MLIAIAQLSYADMPERAIALLDEERGAEFLTIPQRFWRARKFLIAQQPTLSHIADRLDRARRNLLKR